MISRGFYCRVLAVLVVVATSHVDGRAALAAESAAEPIRLGVIAPRGPFKTMKRYTQLAKYFEEQVGRPVKLLPLDPIRNVPFLRDGKVDFLLTNPTITAMINASMQVKLLATVRKNSGSVFGGAIITRADSGIRTLEDIKGKRILAYQIRRSAGGHIFASYHLRIHGIDDARDSLWLRAASTQDNVVLGVLNGDADVGFVRSGIVEYMAAEGTINIDDVYVIDRVTDSGYPEMHSTALYPDWYLIAGSGVDAALAAEIKHAALAITPETNVAKDADIVGFDEPHDLAPLVHVLKTLAIPPFDKAP